MKCKQPICCIESIALGTGQPKAQIVSSEGTCFYTSLDMLQRTLGNTVNLWSVPGSRNITEGDRVTVNGVVLILDLAHFAQRASKDLRERFFKAARALPTSAIPQ